MLMKQIVILFITSYGGLLGGFAFVPAPALTTAHRPTQRSGIKSPIPILSVIPSVQDSANSGAMKKVVTILGSSCSLTVSLSVLYLHLIYSPSSPLFLSFLLSAVMNAGLSKILKQILKVKRPDGSPLADPGMPSSHGMSLGFIFAVLNLTRSRVDVLVLSILYICLCLRYRLMKQMHTLKQLLVGIAIGSLNALLWFSLFAARNDLLDKTITAYFYCGSPKKVKLIWFFAPLFVGAAVVGSFERWLKRQGTMAATKKNEL